MTVSIPYMQRVTVQDKNTDEVYDTVVKWLRYNSWKITSVNQPTRIEARYGADTQMYQIGPQDNFPKNIEIRISGMGNYTVLDITITQEISGMENKGYLYWGIRLQDLYEMLGVEIDENTLSNLLPEAMLSHVINSRTRMLMGALFFSVVIGWLLGTYLGDLGILYSIVFLGPIILIIFWDLQIYRTLDKRIRKRHKIN